VWKTKGPQTFSFKGTGVCSASMNPTFLFPSQVAASTCTLQTENVLTGVTVVTTPGNLGNLRCSATAGGVNASSGVVTVRKNAANTTTTATFGTGTSANDSVHSTAVVVGDIITLSLTTQAAETLANPACQVQVN